MYSNDFQTKLDLISTKIATDPQYAKKFLSDFEFGRRESESVGLQMSPELFNQLANGFKKLLADKELPKSFEINWEKSTYRTDSKTGHNKTRMVSVVISAIIAGIGTYILLRRLSKKSYYSKLS